MGQPHIGEIRLFAGNFAPAGWMLCQGQLVPISEFDTLFNLIGTTYGGDGQETFALPDMRGRVPVHQGQGPGTGATFVLGETGGAEEVTLAVQQMPFHAHGLPASSASASSPSAVGGVPANAPSEALWAASTASEPMGPSTPAGGSQPHDNMQPYLGINYIISLYGVYPSPS